MEVCSYFKTDLYSTVFLTIEWGRRRAECCPNPRWEMSWWETWKRTSRVTLSQLMTIQTDADGGPVYLLPCLSCLHHPGATGILVSMGKRVRGKLRLLGKITKQWLFLWMRGLKEHRMVSRHIVWRERAGEEEGREGGREKREEQKNEGKGKENK